MSKVVRSADFRNDVAAIALLIATDNPLAAERWIAGLDRLIKLIAANPGMGEAVDHLRPGLRRSTYGRYVIFYKPRPDDILLYRILHGARRIEDLLG